VEIKKGYVYYIDDQFFADADDLTLIQNKGDRKLPLYYCSKDATTGLLWLVPMSTQTDKYKDIHDKQVARYGKCLTIVIDYFDGKLNAFLLQNMVPALDKYMKSVHSRRGIPVPAHGKVQETIERNLGQIHELRKANVPVIFTDIEKVEERMLAIRERDAVMREAAATTHNTAQVKKRTGITTKLNAKVEYSTIPHPKTT